jgi:hypothetical protein
MNNLLEDQIEDYVAGIMSLQEKLNFEEKIKENESLRQQVIEIQHLRETLLRSQIRRKINLARAEIKQTPKKKLMIVFGTFAAAASILFFLLSTPIMFSKQEFNYRGEINSINQATEARANEFRKAQEMIEKGENITEAIAILEQISINPEISSNYQRNAKWLLVIAYLEAKDAIKAEKTLNQIKCNNTECPFTFWQKTKIQWQIFWAKL